MKYTRVSEPVIILDYKIILFVFLKKAACDGRDHQ
jgi:hypothetical protein